MPVGQLRARRLEQQRARRARRQTRTWLLVSLLVLVLALVFVLLTGMRPAFDAYGWLVWGRQAAHLSLDISAAPSWKPLTFLFTFPYALVLDGGALWAWMLTAVAAAFAAPILGARIAFRLTVPHGKRWPAVAGAVFAAAGILGIEGYWHFVLIATADPLVVALSLGALNAALAGRPRLAWVLLVGVCLGRPEALPALVVFAACAWRGKRVGTAELAIGLAAIPLLWFGLPALTANSATVAGDVLSESTTPLPGDKVGAVLDGFVALYELPMQLAVLVALGTAVVLRQRRWLMIAAAAVSWLAADVALALHGWGVAPRYMFVPAALLVVLAGAGVGRLLVPGRGRLVAVSWLVLAGLVALVVTLAPHAQIRARLAHNGIVLGQRWARQIHRLHTLIRREGGTKAITACGQPVTEVPYQSILAWELSQNVVSVGWRPGTWIALRVPIVLFEPQGAGWMVRPINISAVGRPVRPPAPSQTTVGQSKDARVIERSLQKFLRPERHAVVQSPAQAVACSRLATSTPTG